MCLNPVNPEQGATGDNHTSKSSDDSTMSSEASTSTGLSVVEVPMQLADTTIDPVPDVALDEQNASQNVDRQPIPIPSVPSRKDPDPNNDMSNNDAEDDVPSSKLRESLVVKGKSYFKTT